jgi:hypothetical protein
MQIYGKSSLFLDQTEPFYLDRPTFGVGIALWMTSDVVTGTNMHATTYLQWYNTV